MTVEPVGSLLQAEIDAEYRAKYGTDGGMTAGPAVESTLRLDPA